MREALNERGRSVARLVAAFLAVFFASSLAHAAKYGDIEVTIKSEPRGTATHGYAEVEFLVTNRSAQAAHEVRITYPKSSYSYGGDHLRAVSKNVTVGAGESAKVILAYPERIELRGNGAGVTIDGREEESALPVGTGSSSRGYYSYGSSSPSRGPGTQVLVLYSKGVDTRFPDWVTHSQTQFQSAGKYVSAETIRADQSTDQWSTNWLSYTRYGGVVVTATDLRGMSTEARNAIGQYVECGGSLFVLGRDPQLPGPWKLKADTKHPVSVANPGFGQCIATNQTELSPFPARVLTPVLESWSSTASPWQRTRTPNDANRTFPVVEDIGVPVKGLLALMFVFVIAIGPINLIVLARKKRKLWLFWTVPLMSFVTCLTVMVYMAVTEGWQGRSRIEGVTILDENTRRASSLGWTGFYTPLLPGSGLRFTPETEVCYQNGEDPYTSSYSRRGSSNSALSIDWTREQHFTSGWLTPRVPAHFALRKSELRRERMTISKGADGSPEAVNGLGADLSQFWYRDENGKVFFAEAIPGGGRAALKPAAIAAPASEATLRSLYTGEWATLPDRLKTNGPALLAPRTYLGVMDAAPFLDDGLPGASVRKTRTVVYGILKEGGDGN